MSIIYTYFDPRLGRGELIRLWKESWERQGWVARILGPGDCSKEFLNDESPQINALRAVGGGMFAACDVINYAWPKTELGFLCKVRLHSGEQVFWHPANPTSASVTFLPYTCLDFGELGWRTASLVHFSKLAIERHFGGPIPKWRAVAECGRTF